jgi:hypothetical protein
MERITFSDSAFIYRKKLGMSEYKDILLELCKEITEKLTEVKTDGFGYNTTTNNLNFLGKIEVNNKLDEVIQKSINLCIDVYETENNKFNMVDTEGWVNIVRAKDPVQYNFKEGKEKYHTHTEINKNKNFFIPTYTYVYYIQMPNNLENEDGVLYIKDNEEKEYNILPREDDLIIMPGYLPHSPNKADKSTCDRIVFAGNVGFSFVKKEKSMI